MAFSVKLLRVSYGLSLLVVSPFSDSINPLLLQNNSVFRVSVRQQRSTAYWL